MNQEKKRQKILMVEDDIFLRKLYGDQLRRVGFEFIEATNGVEGINKVLSENPDLVILDLILPRKNGFDVLAEMRKDPRMKVVPVIILSNLSQEQDRQEALALGAQEYLVKTDVRLSEAVSKIQQLISQ